MTSCAPRRGVALMLVLWLIVVLGSIAAGVAATTRAESKVVINVRARAVARYAAESGIVAATTKLTDILARARTPAEQVILFRGLDSALADVREVELGGAIFGIAVAELGARIDLNNADNPTLLAFLGQFVEPSRASALAAALEDWRDEDQLTRPHGAEAEDYRRSGSPFVPPNRPMQRLDELTRITGFTDSLAGVLAPLVTIHGDGRVNINTAPEAVLSSVPGIGEAGARLLIGQREQGEIFASPAAVWSLLRQVGNTWGTVQASRLTTLPRRILIVSRGWQKGHALTHEIQAVYALDGGGGGARLNLKFWTERDL